METAYRIRIRIEYTNPEGPLHVVREMPDREQEYVVTGTTTLAGLIEKIEAEK